MNSKTTFNYKGKSVLITGGTGSFGQALTKHILKKHPEVERVVVFSRGEQEQASMARELSVEEYPKLHFIIGDVRDKERVLQAFQGIDYVIHTAAMKNISITEANLGECIKTNIGGAENVIEAALKTKVSRVVGLSTDKACAPVSLYGATKLAADKLFVATNCIPSNQTTRFSVVRYGNMMGSSGSVVPFFIKKKETGVLPITHPEMTRFNISIQEGVDMVLSVLECTWGGEFLCLNSLLIELQIWPKR
ncbi:hypothetical protein GCM10022395_15620 [Snuella lapsa]|uniref:Polysaccharide biosynthesis protein CapD-like domain-containing protein n=1 Tax=Snuella lapsa TaxID=870481 RepID=A0ABP6XJ79_9FLAO